MMPARLQSLVLLLTVRDAEACQRELDRQRFALQAGWNEMLAVHTACVALLPADDAASPEAALLMECSFQGSLAEFAHALFPVMGLPLDALFAHTSAPPLTDADAFYRFLSANARRTAAFSSRPRAPRPWRAVDSLRRLAAARSLARGSGLSPAALESRRAAVGMQERAPGVPFVHVSLLAPKPAARPRLWRALRELEFGSVHPELWVRFLIEGERLVCLAYPVEVAPLWSERISTEALLELSAIFANTRGFVGSTSMRRSRRARRLEEFLLDYRVPAGAWFSARAQLRNA